MDPFCVYLKNILLMCKQNYVYVNQAHSIYNILDKCMPLVFAEHGWSPPSLSWMGLDIAYSQEKQTESIRKMNCESIKNKK